jgi:hypothetical protein
MPEFTGSMKITIEVTIKAKNRKQAEAFFDDIYLDASIQTENPEIKILSDNTDLILENYWEIED